MTAQPVDTIRCPRVDLVSLSSACLEALIASDRGTARKLIGARLPPDWPGEARAGVIPRRLEQQGRDPAQQPWLLRAIVLRQPQRRVIGHINFHGPPDAASMAELGHTVVAAERGRGYATEAAMGLMRWALGHGATRFRASISPDNAPSLAMAASMGFVRCGEQMDEVDGLEWIFEREGVPSERGTTMDKPPALRRLEDIDRELGDRYWSPVEVARVNDDWVLRAAAVKGEFEWHSHQDDELFLVQSGEIVIETDQGPIALKAGEVTVIPRGLRHRPTARERALVLLFEPARVQARGD